MSTTIYDGVTVTVTRTAQFCEICGQLGSNVLFRSREGGGLVMCLPHFTELVACIIDKKEFKL